MQVKHKRGAGAQWVVQQAGGLFSKNQALVLQTERDFQDGDLVTMDFGRTGDGEAEPKLDSQILLDYGTIDAESPEVFHPSNCTYHGTTITKGVMSLVAYPLQGSSTDDKSTELNEGSRDGQTDCRVASS